MKTKLAFTVSALALTALAAPAVAQETIVTGGGTGMSISLSGQVNRGVLLTDDGQSTDSFFVDNDNSSTRFRILGQGDIGDTTIGFNIEVQAESNSTANVNQLEPNTDGDDFFSQRKLELFFENPRFGRLTLGQGDTASNGTSEVDLSGTSVVGYSGVSDQAGGILFTDSTTGALTTVNIGSAFTNLDGLSRQDRIRYDTPSFGGVTLGVSAGTDIYDVSANYSGTLGAFTVGGALAYAQNANDDDITNGSVSVLHTPTGLSLTLAAGEMDRDDPTDLRDTSFGYVKLGYQTNNLTSLGTSAFSVDYSNNDDVLEAGDDSTSYGLQFVQRLDAVGTDLYVGYRRYELDRPGANFNDIDTLLVGARVRF